MRGGDRPRRPPLYPPLYGAAEAGPDKESPFTLMYGTRIKFQIGIGILSGREQFKIDANFRRCELQVAVDQGQQSCTPALLLSYFVFTLCSYRYDDAE